MYSRTSSYERKDGSHVRSHQCAQVVNGTGLCDAPAVNAETVDAEVMDHLLDYIAQAERCAAELGSDCEGRQRAEAEVAAAERRLRELDIREEAYADRYAASQISGRHPVRGANALMERTGSPAHAERPAPATPPAVACQHATRV